MKSSTNKEEPTTTPSEVEVVKVVESKKEVQQIESSKNLTLEVFTRLPQNVQEQFAEIMKEQLEFELLQRKARLIQATNSNISLPNAVLLASYAKEKNMSWIEVTNRFCVISGRICEGANSVRARMRQAGIKYAFEWTINCAGEDECRIVETLPDGEKVYGERWSLNRARQAGIASKDVWKKYTREMLMARATTSFVKAWHPELLVDCQVAEEMRDIYDLEESNNEPKSAAKILTEIKE